MCGIWISPDGRGSEMLSTLNSERGDYASGVAFIEPDKHYIIKRKEYFDWDNSWPLDNCIYLGHERAPTCNFEEDGFVEEDNHPFESKKWIVGHNGIIKNVEKLKEKYNITQDINVDSKIIPLLLDTTNNDEDVVKVLEDLNGIFGLWMYNKETKRILLTRCASTLYYSRELNTISSAKIEDGVLLKEGDLYEYASDKPLMLINHFKYNSPYMMFR